ncbi:hypothetical protein D3C80_878030 [compost metagenome]
MVTRIYASHSMSDFSGVRGSDIHKFGDYYVVAVPRELSGSFEIVATATETSFTIERNEVQISYDDIVDLFEQAVSESKH